MRRSHHFSAKIYKIGINPVVDPPDDVLSGIFEQAGKSTGPIPVHGTINGAEFIQTLVKYRGAWRLYANGEMLKASGLKVGDEATIGIEFDPRPRNVPVPNLFDKALRENARARKAFDELAPSRRKEVLRYLGSLKTEESLKRNIEKLIQQFSANNVGDPHIVLRSK
jgi:hypothetical protein